uniref:Uncharacterized protein n=1 Tax=Ciona intestinalis TaxID=7719 RepID=H2XTR4_CIOIN
MEGIFHNKLLGQSTSVQITLFSSICSNNKEESVNFVHNIVSFVSTEPNFSWYPHTRLFNPNRCLSRC